MKQIPLPKTVIQDLVESAANPPEVLLSLYELIPGFKECTQTRGFPCINPKTTEYIFVNMIAKWPDLNTSISMMWMNKGFSSDESVPEWMIDLEVRNFKLING